jgi:hypothetical protein
MKPSFRILSLAALLAAATVAAAQAPASNPAARGARDSFYFGSVTPRPQSQSFGSAPMGNNNAIGRPMGRFGPAVTPVPEPSSWAMMLAGLALVGFMVRRNTKR